MFEGFTRADIDVGEATLRVRYGGSGRPVVLLHGHPRTHATWFRVAPALARAGFFVVCPDLRGYGHSSKPATTPDHEPYSKRAMARDVVQLMEKLGFPQFDVVGHDRGAYVAYRLALDSAESVRRLVVMDGIPIAEALDRCNAKFAASWWHWWFLAQPDKPAERIINRDPAAWYIGGSPEAMGEEGFAEWQEAIHNPAVVHAMCEDYRAGLGIDRTADEDDREAGRTITCPTLFVWSTRDDMEVLYVNPLAIWRLWADDVVGARIDCGHHIAEEAPAELAATLLEFLTSRRP